MTCLKRNVHLFVSVVKICRILWIICVKCCGFRPKTRLRNSSPISASKLSIIGFSSSRLPQAAAVVAVDVTVAAAVICPPETKSILCPKTKSFDLSTNLFSGSLIFLSNHNRFRCQLWWRFQWRCRFMSILTTTSLRMMIGSVVVFKWWRSLCFVIPFFLPLLKSTSLTKLL